MSPSWAHHPRGPTSSHQPLRKVPPSPNGTTARGIWGQCHHHGRHWTAQLRPQGHLGSLRGWFGKPPGREGNRGCGREEPGCA